MPSKRILKPENNSVKAGTTDICPIMSGNFNDRIPCEHERCHWSTEDGLCIIWSMCQALHAMPKDR